MALTQSGPAWLFCPADRPDQGRAFVFERSGSDTSEQVRNFVIVNIVGMAATPGRVLPSSSSRLAPPPVDRWSTRSARPSSARAAAESPPPTTV